MTVSARSVFTLVPTSILAPRRCRLVAAGSSASASRNIQAFAIQIRTTAGARAKKPAKSVRGFVNLVTDAGAVVSAGCVMSDRVLGEPETATCGVCWGFGESFECEHEPEMKRIAELEQQVEDLKELLITGVVQETIEGALTGAFATQRENQLIRELTAFLEERL